MANDRNCPDDIVIERTFDAPRRLVFRNWVDADEIGHWFAPEGYEATASAVEARPGGRWRVDYRSDRGHVYHEYGEFRVVNVPAKLVFSLTQVDGGRAGPETVVTVSFEAVDGRTLMRFRQSGFDTRARRDGNAEGWVGCFNKLAAWIVGERPAQRSKR